MVALCIKPKLCYIYFQYVIGQWKIMFQNSKRPQTHLLISFRALENGWLIFITQISFGVTGDFSLMFPAKQMLYSFSICYWSMENQFSEVKKTSNSFAYELQ